MMTMVGTKQYCAPEIILRQRYNESVDTFCSPLYSFASPYALASSGVNLRHGGHCVHGGSNSTGW